MTNVFPGTFAAILTIATLGVLFSSAAVYASVAFSAQFTSIEASMDGKSELQQRLAILLREAERAHSDYQKSLGHRDDNWPDWYAAYIAERLGSDLR
jgi:hypothetical protein